MTEKIALAAAMAHNELVADLHPDFFVEFKDVAKAVKRLYYENKSITPNMVALKGGPIDDIIVYYPTKEEGLEAIGLLKTEFQKRELKDGFEFAIKMLEKHPMVGHGLFVARQRVGSFGHAGCKPCLGHRDRHFDDGALERLLVGDGKGVLEQQDGGFLGGCKLCLLAFGSAFLRLQNFLSEGFDGPALVNGQTKHLGLVDEHLAGEFGVGFVGHC